MTVPDSAGPGRRWLASRPDFERRPPAEQAAAFLPLERPRRLLEALGRPDRSYRIILVAGTKGKGSTAAFITSMLRAHGLRVGLYSQPHLHCFRERLQVDGAPIPTDELESQLTRLRPTVEALDAEAPELGSLTGYEITTALGLGWFAEQRVDWSVLEVGLGGRLDATNVVEPDVAVITSISYDHTHILGRTLGAIATEKAGIVKPGGLVVSAPQRPAALAAIRRACRASAAQLTVIGSSGVAPRATNVRPLRFRADAPMLPTDPLVSFDVECGSDRYDGLGIHLGGMHQVTNALTAIGALGQARKRGLQLAPDAVRRGLAYTQWPGRLELVRTAPLVVVDGAHNADSAERLLEALRLHVEFERLHLVLGVFADKDLGGILRPFRGVATVIAATVDHPRARPAAEVARAARQFAMEGRVSQGIGAALNEATRAASREDVVCATGSLTVVAAAREVLGLVGGPLSS